MSRGNRENVIMRFMRLRSLLLFGVLFLLCLLTLAAYNLPPVHDRLAWRIDNLRTQIKYALNPPQEAVFVPQGKAITPQITYYPTATATPTQTPTMPPSAATATPSPPPLPTLTPTPLPSAVKLSGVHYEDQHGRLNYCGPSNLSMALTFWGWNGNRDVVANAIKPNTDDKNVMPYEMVDFVKSQTGLLAISRVGGDLELLKTLVANGFPVLIEKGTFLTDLAGIYSWMGHYQLITGYDEEKGIFYVQDTYVGADHEMTYEAITEGWRAFNYTYLIVYPPERETEVMTLLGQRWDEAVSAQIAAEKASQEIYSLSGSAQFFAWFNRGSSLVLLQDYGGAAAAYDEAFAVYPSIPESERPWRMMWYQTGPYFAYFYSGRYYDVLDLATRTLNNMSKPTLEESFYWRGMAKAALGDTAGAIEDFRASLKWHPNFAPSLYQLQLLGAEP
jgi:hypothetical protein